MTEPMYYHTVEGGFDWYGLSITENNNVLTIEEGRVGITDNPVVVVDGGVDGGYYLPQTEITYDDTDRTIDLLLDTHDKTLYVMVRTDDVYEQYDADKYRLLLTLATRESGTSPWLVATPLREDI